jgi:transglutaminase-like putative cysteine protease
VFYFLFVIGLSLFLSKYFVEKKKVMFRKPFIFIFLVISLFSVAQTKENQNFKEIDSLARTIKYENDLPKLVNQLTQNYKTDTEKYRAIFVWITDNIAYDYKTYNKKEKQLR